MATTTPTVIVWLGTSGDQATPLTLFTNHGELLLGHGPMQSSSPGVPTTIGAIRNLWGDNTMAPYLHHDCPCTEHTMGSNTIITCTIAALRDHMLVPAGPVTTEHGFASNPWPT